MNIATIFHYISGITFVASLAHTFLPPWEFLNDFPTAQKYYKAFIYFVGYVAANGRSTVYGSVSTKDGTTPSQVAQKVQQPGEGGN
jgi:hypothetical protein